MKRYARRLTICLLTLLLMALMPNWPCFADWKLVPAGWTTTEPGYFGTLRDGSDTLAAIQTYRKTSETWEAAHSNLETEFRTTAEEVKKQMQDLQDQLNSERRAWKAEVARERRMNLFWIILAGGVGYAAGR